MERNGRLRSGTLLGAIIVVLGVLVAGCGESVEDDPRGAVDDAVRGVAGVDGIEFSASLLGDDGTVDQLVDEGLEREDAELLLDGEIVVGVHDSDAFALGVLVGDEDLVRVAAEDPGEALYLLVNVDQFVELTDADDADVQAAEMFLGGLGGAIGFPTGALFDSEWVAITNASEAFDALEDLDFVDEFAELEGEGLDDLFGEDDVDAVFDELEAFYAESITVEYVGEEGDGDRVRLRNTVEDGLALFETLDGVVGDAADDGLDLDLDLRDALGEVPDEVLAEDFYVDFVVEDEWLRAIEVDLSQVNGWESFEPGDDLDEIPMIGLRVEMREFDGTVQVPEDTAEFDLAEAVTSIEALIEGFAPPPGMEEDPFEDDGFEDDGFEDDGFEDDGFEDDGFEDDGFEDDGFEDDMEFPEPTDEQVTQEVPFLLSAIAEETDAGVRDVEFWDAANASSTFEGGEFTVAAESDGLVDLVESRDDWSDIYICIDLRDAENLSGDEVFDTELSATVSRCE